MSERCCGTPVSVIQLCSDEPGRAGIELHRCSRCGSRGYVRAGDLLRPAEAFAALAGSFQHHEPPAPTHRRSAPTARRAAELAQQRLARAEQRAHAAAQARPAKAAAAQATVDVTDLADLLASWTVLGASR